RSPGPAQPRGAGVPADVRRPPRRRPPGRPRTVRDRVMAAPATVAQAGRVLDSVRAHEAELNALVHVDPDAEAALEAPDPPAAPVVVVKDNIAVRGAPWACGSKTRRDEPPVSRDAEAVRRLRAS